MALFIDRACWGVVVDKAINKNNNNISQRVASKTGTALHPGAYHVQPPAPKVRSLFSIVLFPISSIPTTKQQSGNVQSSAVCFLYTWREGKKRAHDFAQREPREEGGGGASGGGTHDNEYFSSDAFFFGILIF